MSEKENNPLSSEPNNFGLPGDYFQRSAGSIFNKIEWQDEHKDYLQLLRHKNKDVFAVPLNYFDKSEAALELSGLPQLVALQKQNAFKVPDNYFEETEAVLFAGNSAFEDNELQAFEKLTLLSKQNVFKTPPHYFSDNSTSLVELLETKKTAKAVKLFSVKTRYAVAALLVIALGLWVYSFYFTSEPEDCGTLACIDRVDLVKTKTLENLDNDELYEIVNTSKLEETLNTGTDKNTNTIKTDSSSNNDALDDMLDEI